ncbi:MAG: poly(A) polymerase [Gammaproteobacteria bacterium]|nr:poly(A) polymerase [Gammaproteobacteria bacterium]
MSITPTQDSSSNFRQKIYRREEHGISRKNISQNALNVLYDLNAAGYQAYLVGGGVRDLLLGLKPKDFDVATDASPEQVRQVFRNSRIIGRRFQIVHVHYGREIIEVSTFRAPSEQSTEIPGSSLSRRVKHLDSAHSQDGMILRDNVFGSIEEDAIRRDFTVNALYYTVRNFEVLDFTGGMQDLQQGTMRIIGDPELRYREDPVRTLRAIRLATKLDFQIEEHSAKAIKPAAKLLLSVPAARLFDEFLKLFFNGHGQSTFRQLLAFEVFAFLFPPVAEFITTEQDQAMLHGAFASTDKRIAVGKSVTPAFLLAAILWPAVRRLFSQNLQTGMPPMPAMHDAGESVIKQQQETLSIPKRFSIPMREIWEYQLRLERRSGKRAFALLSHKRFRAAYDFLLLRADSGEDLQELANWWTQFQDADKDQRQAMQNKLGPADVSKSRKRRVKSRKGSK